MISRLETLTSEISALHSRLILLIGSRRSGKSALLNSFGERMGVTPLNIGSELGQRLTPITHKQRHLQAGNLLRELADIHAPGDLLLIDNIELLFDPTLQLSPLDLLKKQAHTKKVVAVWPGGTAGVKGERLG
ncbi:MAG: BREX-3 system P-loop-containing protein BrxF [Nitrosomonadales bacterium]